MIRVSGVSMVGLGTIVISLTLRLEPQEVEMLVASARQMVTGWHIALIGLIGATAARSRRSSTSMNTEFAKARILGGRSRAYLAAINDRRACRSHQPARWSPYLSGEFR